MIISEIIGFTTGFILVYTLINLYNFLQIKDKCVVITYYTEFNLISKILILENDNLEKLYKDVKYSPNGYIKQRENIYTFERISISNIKLYNNETIWNKLLLYLK